MPAARDLAIPLTALRRPGPVGQRARIRMEEEKAGDVPADHPRTGGAYIDCFLLEGKVSPELLGPGER